MKQAYISKPAGVINSYGIPVNIFSVEGINIDQKVVKEFGDEWTRFKNYTEADIHSSASMYFDLLNDAVVNKSSYALDIGCGNGRWTKYLADRAGFVEAVEPSYAILAAAELLKDVDNVRLCKTSVENLPFKDDTFDFAMAVGVLHHIPDTQKAIIDCVKKVKPGGYFYCYLYYNLESRNIIFKMLFQLSNLVRRIVSGMPPAVKFATCDILAVVAYMPFIIWGRFLKALGMKRLAKKVPLSDYTDKSFFIIRNDSLDRFGTRLEHRFSKTELVELMQKSGLTDINISPNSPFYHAIGKKEGDASFN